MEKEIITTIGELKKDDKVMGTDGKWHEIELLDIHIPNKMYEIEFENGFIKCSGDHEWTLYGNVNNLPITITTDVIFENNLKGYFVGKIDGPKIINIKEIKPEPVRCIHLKDSKDYLFEILTNIKDEDNFEFEVERN